MNHIFYTINKTPTGYILVAATSKGICCVSLGDNKDKLIETFKKEFLQAQLGKKEKNLQVWSQALIDYLTQEAPWPLLPYDVKATAFQRKVWEYLRSIPSGKTYNYKALAQAIGNPKAARAVARACATNQVALVIPCHRIIPKAGGIGGFRWHPKRKKYLLALENK